MRRRDFLKSIVATVAACTLPTVPHITFVAQGNPYAKYTLLELAKRLEPGEADLLLVAKAMNECNPILADMPWMRSK